MFGFLRNYVGGSTHSIVEDGGGGSSDPVGVDGIGDGRGDESEVGVDGRDGTQTFTNVSLPNTPDSFRRYAERENPFETPEVFQTSSSSRAGGPSFRTRSETRGRETSGFFSEDEGMNLDGGRRERGLDGGRGVQGGMFGDVDNYKRSHLPKLEYRKILNLSMTNFTEYLESIGRVGYSRDWPSRLFQPSTSDLDTHSWSVDKCSTDKLWVCLRKECYLVLCNTIPGPLKYLIRKVEIGDALGVWQALFNRFRHITYTTIKQLKNEWNSLSMKTSGLQVDEFISLVIKKSQHLSSMGVGVDEREEAITLLNGLSTSFDWLQNICRLGEATNDHMSFDQISKLALDYAADKGLLNNNSKKRDSNRERRTDTILGVEGVRKMYCYAYASDKGCSRGKECRFLHEIDPSKDKGKVGNVVKRDSSSRSEKRCFLCKKTGHFKADCKERKTKPAAAAAESKSEIPSDVTLMLAPMKGKSSGRWYFDSGATHHLTNDYSDLVDPKPCPPKVFLVANGSELVCCYQGVVVMGKVRLADVYYSSDLPYKLISESRILRGKCSVLKCPKTWKVKVIHDSLGVLLEGSIHGGLFGLDTFLGSAGVMQVVSKDSLLSPAVFYDQKKLVLFHKQMGHLNFDSCIRMLDMLPGPKPVCDSCCVTKLNRSPITKEAHTRATKPLFRVFADLSGKKRQSLVGYRYYMIIVDDYSRKRWVYLLKLKSEAYQKIVEFVAMVEREQPSRKISEFRSDGGGEFTSLKLGKFFTGLGIKHQKSAPYCQYQNGVAERSIDVVDASARAMLEEAGSETYDWPYAVSHSVFLRNNVTSETLRDGNTPNQIYFGVERSLSPKGVFGCLSYAKVFVRGKQEPKARRAVFLGYNDKVKAAMVRSIGTYKESLREYYSRDVSFDVSSFPYKSVLVPRPQTPPLSLEEEEEKEILEKEKLEELDSQIVVPGAVVDGMENKVKEELPELTNVEDDDEELPELTNADSDDEDSDNEDDYYGDELDHKHVEDDEVPDLPQHEKKRKNPVRGARGSSGKALRNMQTATLMQLVDVPDPKTRAEALASPQRDEWLDAEIDEMKSMYEMKVWELVPHRPGMNVLGNRMLHTSKKEKGLVVKRKARLVAQGFKQRFGIDYNQTFTTTVNMQSIRIFLWMLVYYNLEFYKIDIKTFFLYGELDEEIFMQQPVGYVDKSKPNHVCRLLKSIYGTKQAMRCANKHLKSSLEKIGMLQLKSDEYVYIKRSCKGIVVLCNHVDDIACGATSDALALEFIDSLKLTYKITVEVDPNTYLSLEIDRNRQKRTLKLYQQTFVKSLAAEFKVTENVPRPIPFSDPKLPVPKMINCDTTVPFQELVGSLLWCLKTRPDVQFHVSYLCRYMGSYNKHVYALAVKTLVYLYHTCDYGVVFDCSQVFPSDTVKMELFVDADWGGRLSDSKSTTGWMVRLAGVTVLTACKIQRRPALSTGEAEWNGVEEVCKIIEWFKGFLDEVGTKVDLPVPIWEDNSTAIKLSKEPINPARTKYYRIAQHYVRWCTNSGLVKVSYLASLDHPCDLLNKFSSKHVLKKHLTNIMGSQKTDVGSVNLARVKQCSRREPRRMRMLGSRFASRSNHDPPLVARCTECRCWFPYSQQRLGWISCHERQVMCDSEDFVVSCFKCDRLAISVPALDAWYCAVCNTNSRKMLRAFRPPPARYGQSKD